MKFKNLPAIALAFLFLLALSALAQSKPDAPSAAKNDIAKPANPLALTDAEKADLANLLARYNQAEVILTARLRVVLEIECESCEQDYAVKLGIDDARKFYREQVKAAQAAYMKRLEAIQQAHNCLGCALKDGAFVKPEAKK